MENRMFALIGSNIQYSKSKEWFDKQSIRYDVIDASSVYEALYKVKEGGYDGFNVTTPYKEEIIPLLHYSDSRSVNCVVVLPDGRRIGTSFDGPALFKTLMDLNPPNGLCAILGNGGVLPAILPFLAINRPVHVYARRPKMGEQPLENFNADDYAVIVNTIPFTANLQLNFNNTKPFTYYDLNYADHRLLEQAKANPMCVSCSDGIPMLETQAAMSLDWWKDILNDEKFSK